MSQIRAQGREQATIPLVEAILELGENDVVKINDNLKITEDRVQVILIQNVQEAKRIQEQLRKQKRRQK